MIVVLQDFFFQLLLDAAVHLPHKKESAVQYPATGGSNVLPRQWSSTPSYESNPEDVCLTLSSMIQRRVMNSRSKVTKRQKVLLTSEMHLFSLASYEPTRASTAGPASRESTLLPRRLSITL